MTLFGRSRTTVSTGGLDDASVAPFEAGSGLACAFASARGVAGTGATLAGAGESTALGAAFSDEAFVGALAGTGAGFAGTLALGAGAATVAAGALALAGAVADFAGAGVSFAGVGVAVVLEALLEGAAAFVAGALAAPAPWPITGVGAGTGTSASDTGLFSVAGFFGSGVGVGTAASGGATVGALAGAGRESAFAAEPAFE